MTKATNADKDRQSKINDAKSALENERISQNVPALEKSLEDAKSNIVAKTAELENSKHKMRQLKQN